jgi:hypothetical protein
MAPAPEMTLGKYRITEASGDILAIIAAFCNMKILDRKGLDTL